jgi:hypothetical protein
MLKLNVIQRPVFELLIGASDKFIKWDADIKRLIISRNGVKTIKLPTLGLNNLRL